MSTAEVVGVMVDHPARGPAMRGTDAMGVGDQDWPEEVARIIDPVRSGHLTIAVERVMPGEHRAGFGALAPWQNGGHAGSQKLIRMGEGRETDFNPFDIRDGVVRSGRSGKRQAKVAGAGFCGGHERAPVHL